MKQFVLFFVLFFLLQTTKAQTPYTSAQVHAHNDYVQPIPFYNAYTRQVGSIEADVFLNKEELYVAHEAQEISSDRTLDALYLKPLQVQIRKNKGTAYPDKKAILQIFIDLKTDGTTTLPALVRKLNHYPEIINNATIQIVISGERPNPATWGNFPDYINFDGIPDVKYTAEQLKRIKLFSASFKNYSLWNGKGRLLATDEAKIREAINSAHQQNKKWRFWATPDNVNTWKKLMQLGVNYIGTDDVTGLTTFLKNFPTNYYQSKVK
ncbi:phosphatidylinositol-specific phospholipase C/glycerophosphodiester phosphodiesterase family protein [Adhaeribacter radiodurans]|uniref:phosphatidylinositol-specific phospholipase C/glycerophosphodiester phosphodiesterase family protein n=1 Tax=Adhaeribacter radiodurans TaxID=2745197 RepID=UPI001C70D0FE|nr:phosphatidylinositol-specific phospholipase C/glycerophosphodiester phosphodiesterase family protein [Adhaeribacter radiodurans]